MNQDHDHTAEQLHATHQEDREYNGGKWLPRDQREGGDDAARRDQGGQRQQHGNEILPVVQREVNRGEHRPSGELRDCDRDHPLPPNPPPVPVFEFTRGIHVAP